MPEITLNTNLDKISEQAFKALVAKGIYCLLFPIKVSGKTKTTDTSKNLLNGVSVGNITIGDETPDQEEFQDQLLGGLYKMYAGGAIDPGDLSLATNFEPDAIPLEISGVVNSQVVTPQFALVLAVEKDDKTLQGFFACGANYNGGQGLQGDYGKIIKSNLKFKLTGEPIRGFPKVGTFSKSLYGPLPYVPQPS
ncbi:MAG: hypothetical protein FWC43_12495 [Planctomycetaceae bacterium]|nr:hypothetical protein [Planctomycetaceae bacterium]